MKCGWWNLNAEDGERADCDNEATYNGNCSVDSTMRTPVCADHTCRCSITFEEAARRLEAQRIPSGWMAL